MKGKLVDLFAQREPLFLETGLLAIMLLFLETQLMIFICFMNENAKQAAGDTDAWNKASVTNMASSVNNLAQNYKGIFV